MKTRVTAYFIGNDPAPVKTRSIVYDVEQYGLPLCSWCHMPQLAPVAEIEYQGVFWLFRTRICYCVNCKMGTAVDYEVKRWPESEV